MSLSPSGSSETKVSINGCYYLLSPWQRLTAFPSDKADNWLVSACIVLPVWQWHLTLLLLLPALNAASSHLPGSLPPCHAVPSLPPPPSLAGPLHLRCVRSFARAYPLSFLSLVAFRVGSPSFCRKHETRTVFYFKSHIHKCFS